MERRGGPSRFIATALGYQACQMGFRVIYFSLPKLLQRLHLAKADGSYIKELARIEKYHLLILDDWGIQPLDTGARLAILQLIEDRHGKASTATADRHHHCSNACGQLA